MKKTKKLSVLTIFIAILCIFGFMSCALLLFSNNSTNKAKANAINSQQVSEQNTPSIFGRYVWLDIENGVVNGESFVDINSDGTGAMRWFESVGELGSEPFTWVENNGVITASFTDPDTQEVVATYEITLGNNSFDMVVEEGEEPMYYIRCSDELFSALESRYNFEYRLVNLNYTITNKDSEIASLTAQIDTLEQRIAELEAQIGEEPLPGGEN